MLLIVAAFALGALLGWRRAVARGGDRRDQVQYAAAHGIAGALILVVVTVFAGRLGLV